MTTHSSILTVEFQGQRSLVGYSPGVTNSWTQLKQVREKKKNLASKGQMSFNHCNAQVHGFIHFSEHFWSKKNWVSLQAFILSWRKGVMALDK